MYHVLVYGKIIKFANQNACPKSLIDEADVGYFKHILYHYKQRIACLVKSCENGVGSHCNKYKEKFAILQAIRIV